MGAILNIKTVLPNREMCQIANATRARPVGAPSSTCALRQRGSGAQADAGKNIWPVVDKRNKPTEVFLDIESK